MNIGIGLLYFVAAAAGAVFLEPLLGAMSPAVASLLVLIVAWLSGGLIMWEEE